MKRVCWRAYDYLDCMKKCPSTPEHVKFTKFTRNKCKFALRGKLGIENLETSIHTK